MKLCSAAHIGLTAQALLQAGTTLTLRAVFRRAVHAVTAEGNLIVLTDDTVAAPWALGVVELPLADWGLAARTDGMCVHVANSRICLELAGVRIDHGPARVWTSPSPVVRARDAAIADALAQAGLPHEAPGLAGMGAEPLVEALARALGQHDQAAIVTACTPLVGLGPGLTPAGDDLVAGFLGAVALAGRPCKAPAVAGRTSLLGGNLVIHAAEGALIEPLHLIISALLAGKPAPAAALHCLLHLGHSSGADMLAGAHLALAAISGRPPAR